VRRSVELPLSCAVLAAFSAVAFLEFYRTNMDSLEGPSRTAGCYLLTLAIAAAAALAAKVLFRSVSLARWLLIAAAISFMTFSFDGLKQLVSHHAISNLVGKDHFPDFLLLVWAFATTLVGILVGIFSRRAVFLPAMAAVGAIYLLPPLIDLARARPSSHDAIETRTLAVTARRNPDVYWIVLDGYPRADVLREFFDFDNGQFLEKLKGLHFTIYDGAVASFPETIFSISSTLSLGFLVRDGGSLKIPPSAVLYHVVRGHNTVVNTMRAMGYRYIHFQNGYDNLTQCPLDGALCIKGNVHSGGQALDEFDIALLSRTPLIEAMTAFTDVSAFSRVNQAVGEAAFVRGAVHDLAEKLPMVQGNGRPFFLYGHVLAPHPPIRFRRDCSTRPAAPDLLTWNPSEKPAFLDQLVCVNSEATALASAIVRSDPGAIIVLQSDHGTAFRGQFQKPFDSWDALDLKERFGALNAIRMPDACAHQAEGTVDLVNTFSRVLNCIADAGLPDKEPRQFVVSHAGDMTDVHEYTRGAF
jgi:hypothetical protein